MYNLLFCGTQREILDRSVAYQYDENTDENNTKSIHLEEIQTYI